MRKDLTIHQRDWNKRLPTFNPQDHKLNTTTMVFWWELLLPHDLSFRAPSN
jgi:hypothetical protein